MIDIFFWALAVPAAICVGLSKGGLPVIGMLGVPILSLVVSPVMAAGLLLPVYVVSDAFGLIAYRRDYDGRVLAIIVPAMVVGVGVGWATAHIVSEPAVTLVVGVIGAGFALWQMRPKADEVAAQPARIGRGMFLGAIAGFTSFISHSGAPPYQIYVLPLRLAKPVFAGTATIAFAIINLVKLIPYAALGQLGAGNLKIAAVLALPAALAVWGGVRLVRVLPEKLFFKLVIWALLLVSIKLVYDGATGL